MSLNVRWLQDVTESGALEGSTASNSREKGSGDGDGGAGTYTPRSLTRSEGSENHPLSGGATLLVGMPVVTSRRGLTFWLDLCGVSDRKLREEVSDAFESTGAAAAAAAAAADGGGAKSGMPRRASGLRSNGKNIDGDPLLNSGGSGGGVSSGVLAQDAPFGQVWFETTMSKLRDLGDGSRVAGVHVMAPGPGPRTRARALASTGVFGKRFKGDF